MSLTAYPSPELWLEHRAIEHRALVEGLWCPETRSPFWQPQPLGAYDANSRGQCAPTTITFQNYLYDSFSYDSYVACGSLLLEHVEVIGFHVWLETGNGNDPMICDLTADQGAAQITPVVVGKRSLLAAQGLDYVPWPEPGYRPDMFERAAALTALIGTTALQAAA